MRTPLFIDEAKACRRLACEFAGKSEARFLVRAAELFEQLAGRHQTNSKCAA
jgi:hypothetical protein